MVLLQLSEIGVRAVLLQLSPIGMMAVLLQRSPIGMMAGGTRAVEEIHLANWK
jgi:hypothetical protein